MHKQTVHCTFERLCARWEPLQLHNNHNDASLARLQRITEGTLDLTVWSGFWMVLLGNQAQYIAPLCIWSHIFWALKASSKHLHCSTKPYLFYIWQCVLMCVHLLTSPFFALDYFYIAGCARESHFCGVHSPTVSWGSNRKRHLPATDTQLRHRGAHTKTLPWCIKDRAAVLKAQPFTSHKKICFIFHSVETDFYKEEHSSSLASAEDTQ